jgi:DNA-binding CsgD family transcriptional regulator
MAKKVISEIQQQKEKKNKRIEIMSNVQLAAKIYRTEKKWEELSQEGKLDDLLRYELIDKLIYGASFRWGDKYHKSRLSKDDFLSVFYQAAWKEIERYTWHTDFFLYETLVKAIQSRGRSLLRDNLATDRRRAFHEALPLIEGFNEFYPDRSLDIELNVIEKRYEEQMHLDPTLTDQERSILHIISGGGSQREAARQLDIDRRTISRSIGYLKAKLQPYLIG